MDRRQFVKLALLGVGVPALAACSGGFGASADLTPDPAAAGSPAPPQQPPPSTTYAPPTGVPAGPPPHWRGADISFTLQEEAIGMELTDLGGGSPAPIETILPGHGANLARLRVWVDPPAGYSDEASMLTLARRAHAAGMDIALCLHYSDFWAEPSHQATPAAWAGQSLEELAGTVRAYTADLLRALERQGTPARIVQVGNEVTNGILWPVGQVPQPDGSEDWAALGTLLRAGIDGVHDAAGPSGPAATMLHLDMMNPLDLARHKVDSILAQGVDPDLIGISYYPFWHGSLDNLRELLIDFAGRYRRGLVIAETGYPWTLDTGDAPDVHVTSIEQLPDADRFPPTPQGQFDFFMALRQALADVPEGLGMGLLAWEPGWLPGVGAAPGSVGNPYANMAMFDWAGQGLPSLATFGNQAG